MQLGLIKFYTSSFDVNGYIGQLFPEAILNLTHFADKIKFSSSSLKDVTEQKSGATESVSTLNTTLASVSLDESSLIGVDNNENS